MIWNRTYLRVKGTPKKIEVQWEGMVGLWIWRRNVSWPVMQLLLADCGCLGRSWSVSEQHLHLGCGCFPAILCMASELRKQAGDFLPSICMNKNLWHQEWSKSLLSAVCQLSEHSLCLLIRWGILDWETTGKKGKLGIMEHLNYPGHGATY